MTSIRTLAANVADHAADLADLAVDVADLAARRAHRAALTSTAGVVRDASFAAGRVAGRVRFGRPLTVRSEAWQHLTGDRPWHVLTDAARDLVDEILYMAQEVHPCVRCADLAAADGDMPPHPADSDQDDDGMWDGAPTFADLAARFAALEGIPTAEQLAALATEPANDVPTGCVTHHDDSGSVVGISCHRPAVPTAQRAGRIVR